jgi:hypothetical protein
MLFNPSAFTLMTCSFRSLVWSPSLLISVERNSRSSNDEYLTAVASSQHSTG